MAHIDQPFRRSNDLFAVACAGLFRYLHTWTPVARLLAFSVSEHDGNVASIRSPLMWDVFAFRLRDDLAAVLVCRFDSRLSHFTRPREESVFQVRLRGAFVGLARFRRALASV
jgi:hypothetical protein